jgi:hypothetical protein
MRIAAIRPLLVFFHQQEGRRNSIQQKILS